MKKLFTILLILVVSVNVFGQWRYESLRGLQTKTRVSIEELRTRSAMGAVGDIWFVDVTNGATGNGGRSWSKALAGIPAALTLAGDNDVILVAPGTYLMADSLLISETNLSILAADPDGGDAKNGVIFQFAADESAQGLMVVNGDNLLLDGISFDVDGAEYGITLGYGATCDYTTIRNCYFGGDSITYGIKFTADSVNYAVIDNCTFANVVTAGVQMIGDECILKDSRFIVPAAGIGIEYTSTTTTNVDNAIIGNVITGSNSTDTGIKITNSPNQETLEMVGNSVTRCATPVTVSKYTTWYDGNYWGTQDGQYHSEPLTLWVNASITTAGDGLCLQSAYKTILAAEAASAANYTINVMPGDYEELASINMNVAGVTLKGPGRDNQNQAMIYVADSSWHAMTINAHNVTIDGMGFTVNKDTYDAIRVASTVSTYKTTIKNCRFDGYGAGEYAIHTGTTYDSPDIVVENCLFRSWQTACIYANATRGIYRDNVVLVTDAKIGFEHIPTTGSRPDQLYYDNIFRGARTTEIGLKITNSPTAGTWAVARNIFVNCATGMTVAKGDSMAVFNYGSNATGGAIYDPSP